MENNINKSIFGNMWVYCTIQVDTILIFPYLRYYHIVRENIIGVSASNNLEGYIIIMEKRIMNKKIIV